MLNSHMVIILMEGKHSFHYSQIELNMMKVLFSFYSSIESTELVNQILSHIKQLPGDITDDNSLVVENDNEFEERNLNQTE